MCIIKTYFCDSNLLFPKLLQRFDKQVTSILDLQEKRQVSKTVFFLQPLTVSIIESFVSSPNQ